MLGGACRGTGVTDLAVELDGRLGEGVCAVLGRAGGRVVYGCRVSDVEGGVGMSGGGEDARVVSGGWSVVAVGRAMVFSVGGNFAGEEGSL